MRDGEQELTDDYSGDSCDRCRHDGGCLDHLGGAVIDCRLVGQERWGTVSDKTGDGPRQ